MDLITKITLDMLTPDSVSVLTQQFLDVGGIKLQVGENTRVAFTNTVQGRQSLRKLLNDDYYNAVIAIWGESPTEEELE